METGQSKLNNNQRIRSYFSCADCVCVCVVVSAGLCWFVYSFLAPPLSVKKNVTRKYGSININDKQQNIRTMSATMTTNVWPIFKAEGKTPILGPTDCNFSARTLFFSIAYDRNSFFTLNMIWMGRVTILPQLISSYCGDVTKSDLAQMEIDIDLRY